MLVINEHKIGDFLKALEKEYKVYDVRQHPPHGGLPFKKYFFPPTEETFTSEKKGSVKTVKFADKFVVFGLGITQLEALTYLDEIMSKPVEDYFYWQRRNNSAVIGLIKENTDAMPGGDVVLQDTGDGNLKVFTNTDKGRALIKKYKTFFAETADASTDRQGLSNDTEALPVSEQWSKTMRDILLDAELLANAVEWSKTHKIWDEMATTCLGCGVCTYTCPLCHCFSVEDKIDLTGKCSRCRKWDACTLPEFAAIAGGHNFRPTIKERYYNWFYHKFVRGYKEYGKPQCVGCGHCKKYCPAGIDILEILKTILGDYKKSQIQI